MALKTTVQTFKISPESKEEYSRLLSEVHLNPSQDLHTYVIKRIEELKNRNND